jgi:zinc transport system substrate-binding protein
VAFLINKIKAESIPVVFHIELSNERMADIIAEETGAKKLLLHAAHNISKRDFDSGVGYLELMSGNLEVLKEALQ